MTVTVTGCSMLRVAMGRAAERGDRSRALTQVRDARRLAEPVHHRTRTSVAKVKVKFHPYRTSPDREGIGKVRNGRAGRADERWSKCSHEGRGGEGR